MMLQVEELVINMDQVTEIWFPDTGEVLIYHIGRTRQADEPDLTLKGNKAKCFRRWWDVDAIADVIG